jgi:hypothetical protein
LGRQEALNKFLRSEVFNIVCDVLESSAEELLLEAVKTAYESEATDNTGKLAEAKVQDARSVKHCVEALRTLKKKDIHTTLILTK